jgi:hypothetical protein
MQVRRIDELHEWIKNKEFRSITKDNHLKLKADIQLYGIEDPLIIEEDGNILDGNHRYKAVTELVAEGVIESDNGKSLQEVPVAVVKVETEEDRWRVALRKQSDYAQTTDNLFNFQSEFENLDLDFLNIQLYEPKNIQELLDGKQDAEEEEAIDHREKGPETIICPHCGQSFEQS